jgi:hypothetical protein
MMLTMNLEQHRHQPQSHSLPTGFQHGKSPVIPKQSPQRMIPFDGFSRAQADQHFVVNSSASPLPTQDYSITGPMTGLPQSTTLWSNQTVTPLNYSDHTTNSYYEGPATMTENDHHNNFVRGNYFSDIPRTWASYDPQILNDSNVMMEQLEPSFYTIDEDSKGIPTSPAVSVLEFNDHSDTQRYSQIGLSQSPKMEVDITASSHGNLNESTQFGLQPNDDFDDGGPMPREMTTIDVDDHAADEPYAKLIHRALMSAPNHSMILQEIYQWFRNNTTKGSADSKGWMNSIRHNLSMNAVSCSTATM